MHNDAISVLPLETVVPNIKDSNYESNAQQLGLDGLMAFCCSEYQR